MIFPEFTSPSNSFEKEYAATFQRSIIYKRSTIENFFLNVLGAIRAASHLCEETSAESFENTEIEISRTFCIPKDLP